MAATFAWAQTYGASPGTTTDLGTSGNLFNFKTADDATAANYSSNPITAGDAADTGNSYEVWLRAHFTGTFNNIDNLRFFMSTNFSPATGLSVKWDGETTTYATPTTDDSAVAVTAVPTSLPGTANVSIGGSLAGALTSAGYADYIVLQLHAGSTAAPGDTSLATFTLYYDES